MVDITETNLSTTCSKAAVKVAVTQYSQPPTSPPPSLPNDLNPKLDTNRGQQLDHVTHIHTLSNIITRPTNDPRESTYQPLIPLRAHQRLISTEYQSLRQLSKEKTCDFPPPIPPKP